MTATATTRKRAKECKTEREKKFRIFGIIWRKYFLFHYCMNLKNFILQYISLHFAFHFFPHSFRFMNCLCTDILNLVKLFDWCVYFTFCLNRCTEQTKFNGHAECELCNRLIPLLRLHMAFLKFWQLYLWVCAVFYSILFWVSGIKKFFFYWNLTRIETKKLNFFRKSDKYVSLDNDAWDVFY